MGKEVKPMPVEERAKKVVKDVELLWERGVGDDNPAEKGELELIWAVATWLLSPTSTEDPLELYRE